MSSGPEGARPSLAHRALGLAVMALCFAPSPVSASPWTLSRGEIAVVASYDYQFANQEFLERRLRQDFPLRGRYSASNITIGLRAGFTDRLELGLEVPLKLVSYTSDPIILLDLPPGEDPLDYFQDNIIDFSQTRQGVGDVWLSGRYNLLRTAAAIALEGRIKLPAGYDGPEGTFGTEPDTIEEFLATDGGVVIAPENIRDDVALGDGQIDLNVNALFGVSFPSRTFMRLDTGYNLRVGAGDQVLASFKIGQSIGARVLLYADTRFAYTVTRGPRIGVSVAARDPSLPAALYEGDFNLRLRELRLERDALDVTVGGIVRVGERSEINLGYSRTVWGRNTAAINAFYVGIGIRTDARADEPEPTPEATEPEEDGGEYVEDEASTDELPVEAQEAVTDGPRESPPSP